MDRKEARHRATMRVNAKMGLYVHLVVYACVMSFLVVINLMSSTSYYWFRWPMLGWGIGVAFHALGVFAFTKGGGLRERMIEDELQRDALS